MKHISRMLSLLLALVLLCTCAFAETDASKPLAMVNGRPVDITEAKAEYDYYSMLYTLYGYGEDMLAELRRDITNYYVQLELVFEQYDKLELGKDFDMEAMKAEALAAFESNVEGYKTYVQKDGKTEEEIDKEAREMMEADGYGVDYFERTLYTQERILAVMEYYTADLSVSEEDVRAYYDELVAADKTDFEANPAAYESAVSNGETVLYVPEGFRAVKHILINLSEENVTRMRKLESELASVNLALAQADADIAALTAQKTALEKEADEIFATIEGRAQEVLDKLANGEDFIALMEEYGEDPGMEREPYKTEGYLVFAESAQWVTPFRDGAMALEKVGDVSQPVRTSYGLHIIRYEYDVVSGPVAYEDVQTALTNQLNEEIFNSHFDSLLKQWQDEAEIELYSENLIS